MFSNLLLVTVIIFILWAVAMGYYLYTSQQQESLEDQVELLQDLLDNSKRIDA
ncbi:MAG: hypothetical protein M5U34_03870 [Chloroflexi bacterium]|nr:hypothetical protein [Chloroflexota bacterium]